mgnify:CR=1 FL=1|tara:strand:+ start:467 stop:1207 length:741 start_codon:yes stop_codon:yes gene_type:complete
MKRTNYIIANWKMNGSEKSISLIKSIQIHIAKQNIHSAKVIICPPFTSLSYLIKKSSNLIKFGAQDVHYEYSGAFTGSISSPMLKEIGVKYVIIGHSERRQYHKETVLELNTKINSALSKNLKVIFCIGEKLNEITKRSSILKKQLSSLPNSFTSKNIIIAYEPVWAIGTGKTPTVNEINGIHKSIRRMINQKIGSESSKISILYGGSVGPHNARNILELSDVDGALVGGASLKSKDFCKIIDSSI